MTSLTTPRQKDSANTDMPQFQNPDDQVIGLDTDDTVPQDETHIQNDPETEIIEIDLNEAAVLAYFTNSRRNQLEALSEDTTTLANHTRETINQGDHQPIPALDFIQKLSES